jgi:hypothetical protein
MTRAIALVAALALSGCSLFLVHGPPTDEPEPQHWPSCTEHYFWEAVDASMFVLAAFGAYSAHNSDDELADLGVAFSSGIALGAGVSAITGLGRTQACREARVAYERAALQGR